MAFGDVKQMASHRLKKTIDPSRMLRYPLSLGIPPELGLVEAAKTGGHAAIKEGPMNFHGSIPNTETFDFNWNSDKYSENRISTVGNPTEEPFILFEFLTIPQGSHEGFTLLDAFNKDFAKRLPIGSASLYMTTDIQINDSFVYDEDTRKLASSLTEGLTADGLGDVMQQNLSGVLAGSAIIPWSAMWDKLTGMFKSKDATSAAVKGGGSMFSGTLGKAITAMGGYELGDIVSNEIVLKTGKVANPNEFIMYKNTPLRTFSFNFKFLPSSADESEQSRKIIELFRHSSHAERKDWATVVMPDHVVISFHGAGDMIQIPPVVCTGVNITYNPNAVSFFRQGGEPVEVDMALSFQEMMPIYKHDIVKGY